jgi:hypothetical protein
MAFLLFLMYAITAHATGPTSVIVRITGLVSIADSSATPQGRPPKTVYLQNASSAMGSHIMPHIGVIVVKNTHGVKVLDGRKLETEGDFYWVRLNDAEKLSFLDIADTKLAYDDTDLGDQVCPITHLTSLYFFPRLSTVTKKKNEDPILAGDLDSTYLSPKKVDKTIAAFFDISVGQLDAIITTPVVWAFKKSRKSYGATHQQMLADEADWSFQINGDKLVLQTSQDGGAPIDLLELHPSSEDGKITFFIANAPDSPDHIGVMTLAGSAEASLPQAADHHFGLYYDYLAGALKEEVVRYIPVVAGICGGANSDKFITDPCKIRKKVDIPDPGDCKLASAPQIGGLNCGPDSLP